MKPVIIPAPELVSIDELDQEIVGLCARINSATYDLLILVRQFDERAGWLSWGFDNCADWLHWRCDIGMSAAREKVRVAHTLKVLPVIARAFSGGDLSYTKVRALTRVARKDNEEELTVFALKTTASRVEERCRELRCGSQPSVGEANRAHNGRSLRVYRDLDRGVMTISIEVPLETGELINKALDRARDDGLSEGPQLLDESWAARQADAMVAMAGAYLSGKDGQRNSSDDYLVTIHVDQSALASGNGRSSIPIESVKRLCCDGHTVVIGEDENGEPLNIGRKTRTVPQAIKRALRARDEGCRFPGCHHNRFVDAHHIEHWSNGGETSLDNLMLLCSQHHKLVHEGGFTIERDYQNHWFFKRPDGRAIPANGYQLQDMVDEGTDAETNELSTLFNNPSVEGFLAAAKTFVSEPPPPNYWH